jgi:hypothetical protein
MDAFATPPSNSESARHPAKAIAAARSSVGGPELVFVMLDVVDPVSLRSTTAALNLVYSAASPLLAFPILTRASG